MAIPDFNLIDQIYWVTTRWVPLSPQSLTSLLDLINTHYQSYIPKFAGITSENSGSYIARLNEIAFDQAFYDEAVQIIIPHNFFNVIEFDYLAMGTLFNNAHLTFLLETVEMTPEFSGFLSALQGINQNNNQDPQYRSVIENLMLCPKFIKDAATFPISP